MPKLSLGRKHWACVGAALVQKSAVVEKRRTSRGARGLLGRLTCRTASTVTEYAVIAAIVSIAGVLLLIAIGNRTNALLDQMNSNFPK